MNEEYVTIKTKKEQFLELISRADLKKEDIQKDIDRIKKELDDLTPTLNNISDELEYNEGKLEDVSEEYDTQSQILAQKSTAYNEQNVIFHQKQSQLSRIEQEIEFKQDSYNSSLERINKNQELLRENESEIKQLLASTQSDDTDILGMLEEKENIEAALNESEKEYYGHRGLIDEIEKKQKELQRNKENCEELLRQLNEKRSDLKLEHASVTERLSVEFNIKAVDIDHVVIDPSHDQEELKNKVEKTKNRLENMGPINPMAMEAYNEIKERNDFISSQKEDLIQAKNSLIATIEEIDSVAKETFLKAFYSIEENFTKVFRSLFTNEDQCSLVLTDPDNPLDSDIDIMAQPKGKKPLTINQLSGGEKTLTAISLLFAIYLLKPAPFCIFDEVDAPLDDANIDKFNNIIRDFSKDSQFIIVTHNKRTMASTDVIYGVTMIEQGISRVVPVDLRELA